MRCFASWCWVDGRHRSRGAMGRLQQGSARAAAGVGRYPAGADRTWPRRRPSGAQSARSQASPNSPIKPNENGGCIGELAARVLALAYRARCRAVGVGARPGTGSSEPLRFRLTLAIRMRGELGPQTLWLYLPARETATQRAGCPVTTAHQLRGDPLGHITARIEVRAVRASRAKNRRL